MSTEPGFVTVGFREDSRDGGHCRVSLFVAEEARELARRLERMVNGYYLLHDDPKYRRWEP